MNPPRAYYKDIIVADTERIFQILHSLLHKLPELLLCPAIHLTHRVINALLKHSLDELGLSQDGRKFKL